MMIKIAFFNNKGGVGKTSLLYHFGWMLKELGSVVLLADVDPQANLTSMCINEDTLEWIWTEPQKKTIYSSIEPLLVRGTGDVVAVKPQLISRDLYLLPGDLALSNVEDELSTRWPQCLDGKEAAFRVIASIDRAITMAAEEIDAEYVLIDVGPNLGAINRSALISADYVVVPLAPDLFSIQGLENMGPKLRDWRKQWERRLDNAPDLDFHLPEGGMHPIGYIVSRHSIRSRGPVKAFKRWLDKTPQTYQKCVMGKSALKSTSVEADDNFLATLKDYRSLMPMAQEVRKPMFLLKAADGAIGGHLAAVSACYDDFESLVHKVTQRIGDLSQNR